MLVTKFHHKWTKLFAKYSMYCDIELVVLKLLKIKKKMEFSNFEVSETSVHEIATSYFSDFLQIPREK